MDKINLKNQRPETILGLTQSELDIYFICQGLVSYLKDKQNDLRLASTLLLVQEKKGLSTAAYKIVGKTLDKFLPKDVKKAANYVMQCEALLQEQERVNLHD